MHTLTNLNVLEHLYKPLFNRSIYANFDFELRQTKPILA